MKWAFLDHLFVASTQVKTTEKKQRALVQLAKLRQTARLRGHRCLADFHGGFYECDHVSPWSIAACNVHADLMLIGQDWASADVLGREPDEYRRKFGQDLSSPTNTHLRQLLSLLGLQFSDTYATNAFPFIKAGPKHAPISLKDLENCARAYTLPQLQIVSPRIAVCLGKRTFDAVRRAAGFARIPWREATAFEPHTCIYSAEVYGMPHPGSLGTNNAGGEKAVEQLWQSLAARFRAIRYRSE